MNKPVLLSSMGMVCALGVHHQQILSKVLAGDRSGMQLNDTFRPGYSLRVGTVSEALPGCHSDNPAEHSRNNQLLLAALESIQSEVDRLKEKFGAHRLGVVLGTSTSGTLEAEHSMDQLITHRHFPDGYDYSIQEMGDPSRFLAKTLGLTGPAYTVSTACSSGGKVFTSARSLIYSGVCDAVISGGVDSLCRLTVQGFSALESVAHGYCQPFSIPRDGINLGEGAALFTVTPESGTIALLGVGESSDAWHISAPHPEGRGAQQAMESALIDAHLAASTIDYLNLHGTATPLNDAMESQAIHQVFNHPVFCSSTKTMTGHTLGAAGAIEAALSWLLLSDLNHLNQLPPHCTDNPTDPDIPALNLVSDHNHHLEQLRHIMSNSFAFGGSNVSLILGRAEQQQ